MARPISIRGQIYGNAPIDIEGGRSAKTYVCSIIFPLVIKVTIPIIFLVSFAYLFKMLKKATITLPSTLKYTFVGTVLKLWVVYTSFFDSFANSAISSSWSEVKLSTLAPYSVNSAPSSRLGANRWF